MPAENTPSDSSTSEFFWFRTLNRYQWYVLLVAAAGWLFDTMDQQLFVMAASPALTTLLGASPGDPMVLQYRGYATSIFIAGWATGGLIFGLFGDRIGRTRTMILTILMYSAFTGLTGLSVGWLDFAFYRFLAGMGVGGEFAAGIALVAEVMPAKARPYAIALLQASSTIGNVLATFINLIVPPQAENIYNLEGVQGWRLMFLAGVLPAILVIFIRWGLKEPESWLKAKKEAQDDFSKQMGDVRELFGDRRWRYHSIIGVLLGMAGVMGLWGVIFWLPELIRTIVPPEFGASQNVYVTIGMLMLNVGAFFGIYGFSLIAGRIGRRLAFAIAYSLALASTVLVFGFMTDLSQIWWMPVILGFCTLMIFGGFAVYFPELYPTRLRSTGTGLCYNVARYLAAIGPFVLGKLVIFYSVTEEITANTIVASVGQLTSPLGQGLFSAAATLYPGLVSDRAGEGLSWLTWLSALGGDDNPLRYAALTVALIFLLGLLVLPFAPETKGKPLPE